MVNTKAFLKGMASFSIVPIVTALVSFFVIPLVSNIFPPEEYGKINIFYSVGAILSSAVMLGLDNSLIRYFFEPPDGMNKNSLSIITLLTGLMTLALLLLIAMIVTPSFFSHILFGDDVPSTIFWLAGYVLFLCILRVLNINARMEGNARIYNTQNIAQCIVTKVSFVVIAIWSTYYFYSIVAMTVGIAIVTIICLVLQRRIVICRDLSVTPFALKKLYTFGIPTMLSSFVLNLNASIGKIVLGGFGLFSAAGILAIGTTLANVFTIIPSAFNTFWSPFIYKNYQSEKPFIIKVHDYVMLATIVIVVAIILLQDLLFMIVGVEYVDCKTLFMLIMLNPIQSLICETTGYGIFLKEKPIWNAVISISGALICLFITIVFIPKLEILAAVIAIAISSVFIGAARSIVGQKYYRTIESPSRSIFASIAICLLCSLNYVMAENMTLRVCCCSVAIVLVCIVYRRQMHSILSFLVRSISSRKHQ